MHAATEPPDSLPMSAGLDAATVAALRDEALDVARAAGSPSWTSTARGGAASTASAST